MCRVCTPWAEQGAEGPVEDQYHLEVCPGYASLWAGLGPMTNRARIQYFMRVDYKRRSKVTVVKMTGQDCLESPVKQVVFCRGSFKSFE